MDPLTHALSGALLARATAPSAQSSEHVLPLRTRILVGFLAAAFPDLDLALRLIDTLTYLNWHQGPTHSLVMLPVWAFLLSYVFSRLSRKQYSWKAFYWPICMGIAIHIAGDLITSYGLMLFAPFSTQRFSLPLVFVLDPWFSLIIIAGLLFSLRFPLQRVFSVCALVGLLCYVSFLWNLHERAMNVGVIYAGSQAMKEVEINVLPQPLSAFNWKIIIKDGQAYHVAYINLLRDRVNQRYVPDAWLLQRMMAAYQPYTQIMWQRYYQFGSEAYNLKLASQAWTQPEFEKFREYAVFPVLDRIDHANSETCFWFFDLRFQFPELPPSFRYGMCLDNELSSWRMQRQQGIFLID